MDLGCVITTRGNRAKFKKLLELEPKIRVFGSFVRPHGDSHEDISFAMGHTIHEFTRDLCKANLDVLMVVGDRWETFAAATAAYNLQIPVAHLEGGEVSGSLDHGYRYAITALSKYHFVCTDKARERLRYKKWVWTVGSTSLDCFDVLENPRVTTGNFILAVFHPDTRSRVNTLSLGAVIEAVSRLAFEVVWVAPNVDAGSIEITKTLEGYGIYPYTGFPIEKYAWLLKNAEFIIGNSSSGIREASFFGTPNIVVGGRQDNRERGKNTFSGLRHIDDVLIHGKYGPDYTYGTGNASEKILECLKRVI